jgi:hypothetical protein
MGRRTTSRVLSVVLAAVLGTVLLSGSDDPVTAHPYPHWQELADPPLSPRVHSIGIKVGHRVLFLGGRRHTVSLGDGAAYDLRTGLWHRLQVPVAVTDRDRLVAAAGIVVLRHRRSGRPAAWWRYDPRDDVWSRLSRLPARLSAPSAFGSEVYALSRARVVVYSVQLDRWTALPRDPIRPALQDAGVSASRAGTVVRGHPAAHPARELADRWDGVRWQRTRAVPPGRTSRSTLPASIRTPGATQVAIGGRILVLSRSRAWIHNP